MKLFNFFFFLQLSADFMASFAKKTNLKTLQYDNNTVSLILEAFLEQFFDRVKDQKKNYPTCINHMLNDPSQIKYRRSLFDNVVNFYYNTKQKYEVKEIKENIRMLNEPPKLKECPEYLISMLKNDAVIESDEFIWKLKDLLKGVIGIQEIKMKPNNINLITSFASYYRDSNLRSPYLFNNLNNS